VVPLALFSEFYERHYSLILSTAERRLDSLHDAEEITTEAFRIAWQHYLKGNDLSLPWLYRVVRNLIGNEYRSRSRKAALHEKLVADFNPTTQVYDSLAEVRDAIEDLSPSHREVLMMTYWEELTAPEVSGILAIPATSVRARLVRARRALKAALESAGGSYSEVGVRPVADEEEVKVHE